MDSLSLAATIRQDALRMVHRINASHIGGALSMADLLAVLYGGVLRVSPQDPHCATRDRFILSKGHACAALYSALARTGFFPIALLDSYGSNGTNLMTHASHKVPGVEFSTGSLGHGLPHALGLALAAKRKKEAWRTVVLASDGELDEGSNWEAILAAPQWQLDNLVLIVDYNRIQSLGRVEEVLELEPLADKFKAFRWTVRAVDGHDHAQVQAALTVPPTPGVPTVVIACTVKGKGVSYMENALAWHYRSPDAALLAAALAEVGGCDQ